MFGSEIGWRRYLFLSIYVKLKHDELFDYFWLNDCLDQE